MASTAYVARAVDGLVLAKAQDERSAVPLYAQQQAQQLLTGLYSMSPRCSLEVANGFVVHLLIFDGICYMGIFEMCYPKVLAFTFLEEVLELFREELKRAFGSGAVDHRSHIETIQKPYYFVHFDRQIVRKRAEFSEPTSGRALAKLQGSTAQVPNFTGHIDDLRQPRRSGDFERSHGHCGAPRATTPAASAACRLGGAASVLCLASLVALFLSVAACALLGPAACLAVLGCLAVSLGVWFFRVQGFGKAPRPAAASDPFLCVSDYMI